MQLEGNSRSSAEIAKTLLADGFAILHGAMSKVDAQKMDEDFGPRLNQAQFCRGGFYGERSKRIGRLLSLSPHTQAFVMHRAILETVGRVLGPWCDTIQLNLTQAIAVYPGALAQMPHRDQDMWRGPVGEIEYLVNVMWPFTPYRKENGATLVWPARHGDHAAQDALPDQSIAIEMEPGDALLFLGSTLHGAGGNISDHIRRGMIVSYCLGWLKPYENQWLAYPPDIARSFDPELAALVGYRQHRPNLGNYDGMCPSVLLRDDPPPVARPTDALLPDQTRMIEQFVAMQHKAQ